MTTLKPQNEKEKNSKNQIVTVVTVVIVTSFSKNIMKTQQPMICSRCSFLQVSQCFKPKIGVTNSFHAQNIPKSDKLILLKI